MRCFFLHIAGIGQHTLSNRFLCKIGVTIATTTTTTIKTTLRFDIYMCESYLSSRIFFSVSENHNDRERVEQLLHYGGKKCIEINKQSSNKYTIGCGSFEWQHTRKAKKTKINNNNHKTATPITIPSKRSKDNLIKNQFFSSVFIYLLLWWVLAWNQHQFSMNRIGIENPIRIKALEIIVCVCWF